MARYINGVKQPEDGNNEERHINLQGGTYSKSVQGDCINAGVNDAGVNDAGDRSKRPASSNKSKESDFEVYNEQVKGETINIFGFTIYL